MFGRLRFAIVIVFITTLAQSALAQDAPDPQPMKPFSVALRDVGIVDASIGGVATAVGAVLVLGSSPPCTILSCPPHPEWLIPGAIIWIIGLAHVAFGIPAIVIGSRRVHRSPITFDPRGVRIAF